MPRYATPSSIRPDQTPLVGGNVGIGTTTPAAQLEVNGNVNLTSPLTRAYQSGGNNVLTIPDLANLFVGVGAGRASGGTFGNTFSGYQAGFSNTTGNNNFM